MTAATWRGAAFLCLSSSEFDFDFASAWPSPHPLPSFLQKESRSVRPFTMPLMRLSAIATDEVPGPGGRDAVVGALMRYFSTDTACYRSPSEAGDSEGGGEGDTPGLAKRQVCGPSSTPAEAWEGGMPRPPPPE